MSSPVNPAGAPPPGTFPFGLPVDDLPTGKDLKGLPPLFHNTPLNFLPSVGKGPADGKGYPEGMPELDGLDEDLKGFLTADFMLSVLGDLEKILAESMSESNEEQIKLAKERIEVLKDQISKTREERLKKVEDTMKEMDKASRMSVFMKVFGWLMTLVTVAMAIATSIVTGGAAAGFAIGAAVAAVSFQVLNETGVMDKLAKALTESLQKTGGYSKQKAMILAQVVIAVVQIGAMLLCGGIGYGLGSLTKGAAEAVKTGAKTVAMTFIQRYAEKTKKFCETALTISGFAMMGLSVYNGYRQYEAGNEQAKLKEIESFIARLQQGLDESDEELQKLVEQLQSLVGEILKLVTKPIETVGEIQKNFV